MREKLREVDLRLEMRREEQRKLDQLRNEANKAELMNKKY